MPQDKEILNLSDGKEERGFSSSIKLPFITNESLNLSNGYLVAKYPIGHIAKYPVIFSILVILGISIIIYLVIPQIAHRKVLSDNWEKKKIELSLYSKLAHDLRSPLELLDNDLDINNEDDFEMIRSIIDRVKSVSNELLRKSKSVDVFLLPRIKHLISEKERLVRKRDKDISIKFQRDENKKLEKVKFSEELVAVCSNLIDNAIDAIEVRGEIDFRIGFSNNNSLLLTVKDNGSGMSKSIVRKLGKEKVTYQKENGNGLGFYNARQFINEHDGKIIVDSKLGLGTKITIQLPVV